MTVPAPMVFISYSWDSEDHKRWVRELATRLQQNGVEVLLDQWDTHPGIDLALYMEQCVRDANFVLLVCTPKFALRANGVQGGVGYEKTIVTGEIFYSASSKKFVPILRSGEPSVSIPSYLKTKQFVDFRSDDVFEIGLDTLLRQYCHCRFGTSGRVPHSFPVLGKGWEKEEIRAAASNIPASGWKLPASYVTYRPLSS
jgi:hypothetical protein